MTRVNSLSERKKLVSFYCRRLGKDKPLLNYYPKNIRGRAVICINIEHSDYLHFNRLSKHILLKFRKARRKSKK